MKTLDFFERRKAAFEQHVIRPMISMLQFGRFVLPIARADDWIWTWRWPENPILFDPKTEEESDAGPTQQ